MNLQIKRDHEIHASDMEELRTMVVSKEVVLGMVVSKEVVLTCTNKRPAIQDFPPESGHSGSLLGMHEQEAQLFEQEEQLFLFILLNCLL